MLQRRVAVRGALVAAVLLGLGQSHSSAGPRLLYGALAKACREWSSFGRLSRVAVSTGEFHALNHFLTQEMATMEAIIRADLSPANQYLATTITGEVVSNYLLRLDASDGPVDVERAFAQAGVDAVKSYLSSPRNDRMLHGIDLGTLSERGPPALDALIQREEEELLKDARQFLPWLERRTLELRTDEGLPWRDIVLELDTNERQLRGVHSSAVKHCELLVELITDQGLRLEHAASIDFDSIPKEARVRAVIAHLDFVHGFVTRLSKRAAGGVYVPDGTRLPPRIVTALETLADKLDHEVTSPYFRESFEGPRTFYAFRITRVPTKESIAIRSREQHYQLIWKSQQLKNYLEGYRNQFGVDPSPTS